MSASAKVAETGRDPSAVTSVIRHTVTSDLRVNEYTP